MAKTGSSPRRLKLVNKVIVALNRRGLVVEHGADLAPESFAQLAGRCPVFRVEAAGLDQAGPAGA